MYNGLKGKWVALIFALFDLYPNVPGLLNVKLNEDVFISTDKVFHMSSL